MPNANADANFRTDRCFQKERNVLENNTLRHYWYDLPHNNFVKRYEPVPHSSRQYTKIRTKNTNYNPAFYGKPMNVVLRKDLDEDWDVKQDCYNPYPSLSREQVDNMPNFTIGRNGTIKTDPKSIETRVGNRDRTGIQISKNQYLSTKTPMKQSSGFVN